MTVEKWWNASKRPGLGCSMWNCRSKDGAWVPLKTPHEPQEVRLCLFHSEVKASAGKLGSLV